MRKNILNTYGIKNRLARIFLMLLFLFALVWVLPATAAQSSTDSESLSGSLIYVVYILVVVITVIAILVIISAIRRYSKRMMTEGRKAGETAALKKIDEQTEPEGEADRECNGIDIY